MVEASWEIPTFEFAHNKCLLELSFPEQLCLVTSDSPNNGLLPFLWGHIRPSPAELTGSSFSKMT